MPTKNKVQKKKKSKKKGAPQGRATSIQTRAMPASVGVVTTGGFPSMNGKRAVRVKHTEFVGSAYCQGEFPASLTGYRVNPANVNLFPWLSGLARNFEKYTFNRLVFRYVPRCATSTTAYVSMAMDFDAADNVPASRDEMMAYVARVTGPAYLLHSLSLSEYDMKSTVAARYTLEANAWNADSVVYPSNVDKRLYDMGYMYISTQGQNGIDVGDLWVDYDVDLLIPEFAPQCAPVSYVAQGECSSCVKTDPLGTVFWHNIGSALYPLTKSAVNNKSILKLPRGPLKLLCEANFNGTSMSGIVGALCDIYGVNQATYGTVTKTIEKTLDDASSGRFLQWYLDIPAAIDAYFGVDANATSTITSANILNFFPAAEANS